MCGSAPSAPQLPAYPNLTPQEQQILGQWGNSVNQQGDVVQGLGNQLQGNQSILQALSGLLNPDGTVNQNAIASLQSQLKGGLNTAGQAGQQQLSSLTGNANALNATQQAYTNALQGNTPANQQLQYTTQQNWNQLREQAAQQGIDIQGDNWQTATSNSTAGQKLLQDFQQNYNIQNQNYQLGYLGQLGGNMQQLAGAAATTANTGMGLSFSPYQTQTGALQNSISNGIGALTPFLQNYQSSLGSYYQPYLQQQLGPYQQQMAQAQANYQAGLNQYNASQNQMMGWANLGVNAALSGASAYGKYFA